MLGDSVTTDHISPQAHLKMDLRENIWLKGESKEGLQLVWKQRGNHEVMMRGLLPTSRSGTISLLNRGGFTPSPDREVTTIYEASRRYISEDTDLS